MDTNVWMVLVVVAAQVGACVTAAVFIFLRGKDKAALAALGEQARKVGDLQAALAEKDARLIQTQEALSAKAQELSALQATLESERRSFAVREQKQVEILSQAQAKFTDVFKSLSSDTLRSANAELLKLAKEQFQAQQSTSVNELENRKTAIESLLKPLREQMEKLSTHNQEIEKARTGAYRSLEERLRSMAETEHSLTRETGRLVSALKDSKTRGSWGEIQLRRVVEMAGMVEHCDFEEQFALRNDQDRALRPDMVVRLPQEKTIIIDAKATLDSYLRALDCESGSAQEKELLEGHARQMRDIIKKLGSKEYTKQFDQAPEFVVMFLPGDGILSAAWAVDPDLMAYALRNNVVIATPTTLIGLLSTVALCWKECRTSLEIREIVKDASTLYGQMCTLLDHLSDLGKLLKRSSDKYDELIGSLESRFLPSARKMEERSLLLKTAPGKTVPPLPLIHAEIRLPGQKGESSAGE